MSPKEARVALFEDDSEVMKCEREIIEAFGGKVVWEAATKEEAQGAIEHFNDSGDVNSAKVVVVTDGNLGLAKLDGEDGRTIVASVRGFWGDRVPIIGVAVEQVEGANQNLIKPDIVNLGEIVIEITPPKAA